MTNPISSEALDLVLRAIQQSSKPVNLANLKKAIPKSSGITEQNMKELLNSLVESGQIQVHRAKSTVYWTRTLEEQASSRILEAFHGEKPLTKTDLKNKFKSILIGWPDEKREDLLHSLVESGQIRTYDAQKTIYWLPPLEEQVCQQIFEAIGDDRLTKSALERQCRSLLRGWPTKKRDELLAHLVKAKRVYELPPLKGTSNIYSARPANPRDYLQKPFEELAKAFKQLTSMSDSAGITPEQVSAVAQELWQQMLPSATVQAPTPPVKTPVANQNHKPGQLLLDQMMRLSPAAASGALVSLTELRQALRMEIPGKEDFDRLVLELADTGLVALHRHDYPSSLSPEERDALVLDNHGNYYIGIALTE